MVKSPPNPLEPSVLPVRVTIVLLLRHERRRKRARRIRPPCPTSALSRAATVALLPGTLFAWQILFAMAMKWPAVLGTHILRFPSWPPTQQIAPLQIQLLGIRKNLCRFPLDGDPLIHVAGKTESIALVALPSALLLWT